MAPSKGGFVTLQFGQRRPFEPGHPVTVADGETLQVSVNSRAPGDQNENGRVPLTVTGADITGVRLTTSPGITATGTVVFEGTSPRTGDPTPKVFVQNARSSEPTFFSGDASNGLIAGSRGEPLKDYVVVVQPAEAKEGTAATRYVRTARPDQEGRFRIHALPPGRYLAAAVELLEQGREWEPEFSRRVRESGTSFTLAEGQTLAVSLKLANIQ